MYIVTGPAGVFVIDPSVSPQRTEAFCDAKTYFSSNDQFLLDDGMRNCSFMEGSQILYDFPFEDVAGKDGQLIFEEGDTLIKLYETPGHSMGSVCYLISLAGKEKLFTGDTVFYGSIGRTDMPGGSYMHMLKSLNRIKDFDPGLCIYPGHGPDSVIKDEIRNNPYFDL